MNDRGSFFWVGVGFGLCVSPLVLGLRYGPDTDTGRTLTLFGAGGLVFFAFGLWERVGGSRRFRSRIIRQHAADNAAARRAAFYRGPLDDAMIAAAQAAGDALTLFGPGRWREGNGHYYSGVISEQLVRDALDSLDAIEANPSRGGALAHALIDEAIEEIDLYLEVIDPSRKIAAARDALLHARDAL